MAALIAVGLSTPAAVAAETDDEAAEECRTSEDCQTHGRCAFGGHGRFGAICEPQTDEHCRQAEVCETEGRCSVTENRQPQPMGGLRICISEPQQALREARRGTGAAYRTANLERLDRVVDRLGDRPFDLEARRSVVARTPRYAPIEGIFLEEVAVEARLEVGEPDPDAARYRLGCREFMEAVEPIATRRTDQDGYTLELGPGVARASGRVLFDDRDRICPESGPTMRADANESVGRRFVSRVGPLVTVERAAYRPAGYTTSQIRHGWETYDLRTGRKARLDDLVDTGDLLEQLRTDPWIQDRVEDFKAKIRSEERADSERREAQKPLEKFEETTDLDVFNEALNEIIPGFGGLDGLLGGHGFYAYDADRERVAMRIEIISTGWQTHEVTTLGTWIEPKPEYREYFETAKQRGWLMPEIEKQIPGYGLVSTEEIRP